MFNAEQKMRYISESELAKNTITQRFEKISVFEELYNKDCSNFTINEIIAYYKFYNTTSLEFLLVINSALFAYTNWCINQGLVSDSQNHYSEINTGVLIKCINSGLAEAEFITRDELLEIVNKLDNPCDAALALAMFEGVYGKSYNEVFYMSTKDIDGNILHTCEDRYIKISDELKNYIYKAEHEYTYYCYESEDKSIKRENVTHERQLDINDAGVFKASNNVMVSNPDYIIIRQRLNEKLRRLQRYTGYPCFKGKKLVNSGRVDMFVRLRNEKKLSSWREVYNKNKKEIENQYGEIVIDRYIKKLVSLLGE